MPTAAAVLIANTRAGPSIAATSAIPPTCRSRHRKTTLRIEVRRFYGLNPTCQRRTFAETPVDLLAPRARRTRRLGETQARVGLACGGAGGARLLTHLHMPASRATVLRLVSRMPMPNSPAPLRIGIDDWAIRKGSRYGTIVVDLDRHRVIDLLPDRTAPTLAGWLERHAGVELIARDRLRKYAGAETFRARLPHGAGPSLLDPHVAYLAARIEEGCENANALWREIREQGYPGTSRQVHRFVAERRTRPVRSGRKPRCAKASVSEPPVSETPLPPSRQLAWLLVQPTSVLDEGDAAVVSRIEQDDTARVVTGLARRFTALVRAAGTDKTVVEDKDAAADLAAWITQARTCDAPAIATFASGLDADIAAVRAALTETWSSGQAEGQVNRLKLIKRQCYGRASLELLKRRMVLAA